MITDRIFYWASNFVTNYKLKKIVEENSKSFKSTYELAQVAKSIQFYVQQVDVLIDIGAHKGLFSIAFNTFIKTTKTICIEPNRLLGKNLIENCKEINMNLFQVGLSNAEGEFTYFVHEDSTMNSIVEANLDVLKAKFPYDNPDQLREEKIHVTTLDNLMDKNIKSDESIFIKIDTQGNEYEILLGSINTLKRAKGCLIEHMFVDAYKSSYSFIDLILFMKNENFELVGVPAIIKRKSFEISSADFLFLKKQC